MARTLDDDPDASLLVRTDFMDETAWEALRFDATRPYGPDGFSANFAAISDEAFAGMGADELASLNGDAPVVFAADRPSMAGDERTLIVVDRNQEPGRSFRVVLRKAWAVENNLRLANMDFAELARAVDSDGVFRGFAA